MSDIEEITDEEREELGAALEAEKDSLEEELAEHGKEIDEDWEGSSTSEGEESDANDAADNIEELVTNSPLVEELEARHKEVREALKRIENGTYGFCEECGEPIPFDRLEANPAARTCIAHA